MFSVSDDKTIRVLNYKYILGLEFERIKIEEENRECPWKIYFEMCNK